jgi:hypothetical protein
MKNTTLVLSVAITVTIAGVAAFVIGAGAERPPFAPLDARENISALRSVGLFSPPTVVNHLDDELRPGIGQAHSIGVGYAWTHGQEGVCVMMMSRTGGCISEFSKPAMLFLTGQQDGATGQYLGSETVEGMVPDTVKEIVLVTSGGQEVPAPISQNGFNAKLPPGAGLVGERVTLDDGTTFFQPDVVSP